MEKIPVSKCPVCQGYFEEHEMGVSLCLNCEAEQGDEPRPSETLPVIGPTEFLEETKGA